ncbi:MAG: hypothetical protein LDL53_02125 [Candidatus Hydrogenedens sp.]|nr:hypothetical protein [Candidatus Hydrogenedens sp.]
MRRREVTHNRIPMKMVKRLAILGGSSVYIPAFLYAVMKNNLRIKEIVLIGRNPEKLEIVSSFCKRMADNIGYPLKIKSSVSIEEGIEDAQIIISHIRVGGFLARIDYEKRPLNYDLIGDESFGAGSFMNAVNTLPIMLEVGKIIASINPDAWLINMTNPMGLVVETLTRYANLKHVIGICETTTTYKRIISDIFRVPEKQVRIQYIGLYHLGVVCDVLINGESVMVELIEKIDKELPNQFDHELMSVFNVIPSRALRIFLRKNEYLKEQQRKPQFRSEMLYENESKILNIYKDEQIKSIPDIVYERNPIWYEDLIVPLIRDLQSIYSEEHIICVPNKGYIPEFPYDTSVEIPCEISRNRFKPSMNTKLPEVFRGLLLTAKESDRLMIESVINRSYEYALKSLTINPFVNSYSSAKSFLDGLVKERRINWRET